MRKILKKILNLFNNYYLVNLVNKGLPLPLSFLEKLDCVTVSEESVEPVGLGGPLSCFSWSKTLSLSKVLLDDPEELKSLILLFISSTALLTGGRLGTLLVWLSIVLINGSLSTIVGLLDKVYPPRFPTKLLVCLEPPGTGLFPGLGLLLELNISKYHKVKHIPPIIRTAPAMYHILLLVLV